MKTRFKIIVPALIMIVLTMFATWYISYWKSPSDIVSIKITAEAPYFNKYDKYFIDFKSNTFTGIKENYSNKEEKTLHFSNENKKYFVGKANMYDFFGWKESYLNNASPNDSELTVILITYSDSSEQKIYFQKPYIPLSY